MRIPDLRSEEFNLQIPYERRKARWRLSARAAHSLTVGRRGCSAANRLWDEASTSLNESAPTTRGAPKLRSSDPHAAILAALPSRTFLTVVMGIARGFIASGTTRTSSAMPW
jgi:hypothetical protein